MLTISCEVIKGIYEEGRVITRYEEETDNMVGRRKAKTTGAGVD